MAPYVMSLTLTKVTSSSPAYSNAKHFGSVAVVQDKRWVTACNNPGGI